MITQRSAFCAHTAEVDDSLDVGCFGGATKVVGVALLLHYPATSFANTVDEIDRDVDVRHRVVEGVFD
jgi:hypothetical protein